MHVLKFKDDADRNISTVMVEARYIPVPVKLEARESVNSEWSIFMMCGHRLIILSDQGILRVELIDGREIRGVDRGGLSCQSFFSFNLSILISTFRQI